MAVPLTAASVGRSLSGSLWVCWKRWRQERIMKDLLSGPKSLAGICVRNSLPPKPFLKGNLMKPI